MLVLAVGTIVFISGRTTVLPYVVKITVDPNGNVLAVSEMDQKHVVIEKDQKYFIGRFVENIRTISSDPIIVKDNWLRAYKCVTSKGNGLLTSYAKANDPFKLVGKITVTPTIEVINKITDNSFQVEWNEKVFDYSGKSGTKYFSGVFSVKLMDPDNSNYMANPLGIFIDEMQWTEKN